MKKFEILLVHSDDALYHPLTLRWALEDKGYRVTTATGSGSAEEILHKKDFDLVISDLLIVLEKTKELNSETMTILVLTTDARKLIPAAQAIWSVVDDYLFVPFELAELEIRVTQCLEKLELKRANWRIGLLAHHPEEKILNGRRIMSQEIRESLVFLSAALNLLSRGCSGEMDGGVKNALQELLSKTMGLIEITEEYLHKTFSVHRDLATGALDLIQDHNNPMPEEHRIRIEGDIRYGRQVEIDLYLSEDLKGDNFGATPRSKEKEGEWR